MSIHAFHKNGLYSRLPNHSMSLAVLRRCLSHTGLRLILCW